jgi:AcrR family transcriptional regulator
VDAGEGAILRRDGYWPTTPVVGSRGARTRGRIVVESLRLFEEQGFRATSVESIATAAGISRAALYQYFESKEQIFVELIEECGGALRRVARRIGPLGPTRGGFENLHWWLGEWAWVYDKYSTVFVQWADIEGPGTAVRPLVAGFVRSYNARIAARLAESGVRGLDPDDAAMVLTSVVHRFNYFRHRRADLPPAEEAIDGLAVVMQLVLFPETPSSAFADLPRPPADPGPPVRLAAAPATVDAPAELSPRATATVHRIVEAGARLFAARGYHATSVDDIVTDAGFARTTFYKYFDEKADLLVLLAEQAAVESAVLSGRLAALPPHGGGAAALRAWLDDYLPFYWRYTGVFRAWVDGVSTDPRLVATAERADAAMTAASRGFLEDADRPFPVDHHVTSVVLLTVLDRLPEAAREAEPGIDDARIAELAATVVERGLLSRNGS